MTTIKNNISNYFSNQMVSGPTEEEILNGSAWNPLIKKTEIKKAVGEGGSSDNSGNEKWITVNHRHIQINSKTGAVLKGGQGMNGGSDIKQMSSNGSASVKSSSNKPQIGKQFDPKHKEKIISLLDKYEGKVDYSMDFNKNTVDVDTSKLSKEDKFELENFLSNANVSQKHKDNLGKNNEASFFKENDYTDEQYQKMGELIGISSQGVINKLKRAGTKEGLVKELEEDGYSTNVVREVAAELGVNMDKSDSSSKNDEENNSPSSKLKSTIQSLMTDFNNNKISEVKFDQAMSKHQKELYDIHYEEALNSGKSEQEAEQSAKGSSNQEWSKIIRNIQDNH